MWTWRKKAQTTREREALHGAPTQRRVKTYSAQAGFVYQYFYSGHRELGPRSQDTEYVFQVSADRKHYHPISIMVTGRALEQWSAMRGRATIATERYAVAKMSLFGLLDQEGQPVSEKRVVCPSAETIDKHLERLGRL